MTLHVLLYYYTCVHMLCVHVFYIPLHDLYTIGTIAFYLYNNFIIIVVTCEFLCGFTPSINYLFTPLKLTIHPQGCAIYTSGLHPKSRVFKAYGVHLFWCNGTPTVCLLTWSPPHLNHVSGYYKPLELQTSPTHAIHTRYYALQRFVSILRN